MVSTRKREAHVAPYFGHLVIGVRLRMTLPYLSNACGSATFSTLGGPASRSKNQAGAGILRLGELGSLGDFAVDDEKCAQVAIAVEIGDEQVQAPLRIDGLLGIVDGVVRKTAADRNRRLHLGLDLGERVPIGEGSTCRQTEQQCNEDREKQPVAQRHAERTPQRPTRTM